MPAFPPGVHLKGGRAAAPVHAASAREFYAPLIPIVLDLHQQGLSLREIATELEERGIKPRLNYLTGTWAAAQVRRVLMRAAAMTPTAPVTEAEEKAEEKAEAQGAPPAAKRRPFQKLTKVNIQAAIPAPDPQPLERKGEAQKAPSNSPPAAPPANIQLWLHNQVKGPFTEPQLKAMLDASMITLETLSYRPGMAAFWRPLRELFGGADTSRQVRRA
jgi:hypothetical protein